MNQSEVREYNLNKCNERLKINYLKLPLLLKRIKELQEEKDALLERILEDVWCIELEGANKSKPKEVGTQRADRLNKRGDTTE